jgi:hypothetical protein
VALRPLVDILYHDFYLHYQQKNLSVTYICGEKIILVMMELTEDFLKLLQIAFIVTGVLAIFFTYIQYNILVSRDVAEREAYVFGDYMLSSPCLVYSDGMRLKSVFDESRLDSLVSNHDCIRYENYMLEISLLDNSKSWKIGDIDDVTGSASFSVAVRMNSETKPAIMKVSIEKLVVLPVQEMVSCVEQCVSLGFEKGECASAGTEGTSGATGSSGDTSGILTFTGIGTDYLLHYDGGSAERWISEGWIDNIAAYKSKGYVASRLGFRFTQGTITGWASGSSALDYTKFDRVLEIFDSRGLKVIPVAWDDQSMKSAFLSTYKQDWINFASHYINDDRIVAFELGSEPNTPMLNDWIETTNGFYQTPRDYYRLIAEIVDAIHDVDPDRICIVPYPYIIGSYGVSFSKWKEDLDAVGLTNKPYVMFDVAHPYFMENEWDMGMTPEQKASWVGNGQLAPAVAAFGADRCFAGETFPWLGEMTPASPNVPSHQPDPDLQLRWTIAIINEYAKYGVSFDLWSCTGNSKWPVTTQAIDASNYKVSSSEIQYTDTNIVHSPEQWKFIAGAGGAGGVITFMPEDIAQHVMDLGANGVYLPVYSDGWGSEVYQHNGLTQTEHKIRYAKEIHRLGGLVYFQVYPYSFQLDTDWDVHVEKETEVIYNTGGMQDTYIQWAKNVINGGYLYGSYVEGINPEIVQIMNEVKGDLASGYATEAFWDKYIDFCNRYMDEISQTKPGVVFTVSSVPFWDLNEIAKHANEFVVPEGSELYFSFHYYYSLWNYPPSSSEAGSLAYWNNLNPLTQAQWDNARDIAFNDYYLNKRGIKALLDMGKKVIWDEVGTNIHNVNIEEWMRDVREFSDTYAIGTSFLDNTVHEGEAYNQMPGALWDDGTWNLNYLGQLWSQIIKPGGTKTTCSGEDIGQDGCGANQICCCSGTFVPQGGDITFLTCDKLCLGMYGSKYSGTCIAGECTSGKTPETPACSGTCCCFESYSGTPVPTTATNQAVIPENWEGKSNQIGDRPGEIIYPSDSYNGFPSIELREDNTDGWKAEVNGDWTRIYPGDRIVMRSWIKTTSGTAHTNSGARIALDYYSGTARINGPSSAGEAAAGTSWVDNNNFAAENEANFVKWGQTSWVLREWDFIVPDIVIADGLLGYPQGQQFVPVGMAPWMQVMGTDVEDNAGYFANFELFIYRSGAWL